MVRSQWNCENTCTARLGVKTLLTIPALVITLFSMGVQAESSADFSVVPPLLGDSASPRVMLLMSNDQQLYYKAYTDYTDLDGDGELDTTYNDGFEYYGYFNSDLCYTYTNNRFEPGAKAVSGHQCSNAWSGNFLNWASMTRMDIVRRVYYGGKRVVDTATETVLQRTLLPTDAHAFVKVFDGDVDKYTPYNFSQISLCNVTLGAGDIKDVSEQTYPPLLRVAEGSYPQWSATEVVQCLDQSEASSGSEDRPARVSADLNVHVLACDSALEAGSADYCRPYGSTPVYKPAGLLQENGEDGGMLFGLMTGTHGQKMAGGILRRNIMALANNPLPADDEIDLSNGRFRYLDNTYAFSGGIIETLDRMRIGYWDFGSKRYDDCNTYSIQVDDYIGDSDAGKRCSDWGNPLAEIYMEALRYFAAESSLPTPAFSGDVDSFLGLGTEAWRDPLSAEDYCARCSIIVMSTGLNSFDADDLDLVADLAGLTEATINDRTDAIGANEGIHGESFMVGNVMGDTLTENDSCTAKTVNALSNVQGVCPEMPSLQGSYQLGGLAYWAQTNDLRTDTGMDDVQRVDTYTVALAESLPSFQFNVRSGAGVSIVPACQATPGSDWTDCSIVDATVVARSDVYTRIDIAWEDSLWGNDYDMDGFSTIEVCTSTDVSDCEYQGAGAMTPPAGAAWGTAPGDTEILVRVSVPKANAGNSLKFGVIVGGTVTDGVYMDAYRKGGNNYTCIGDVCNVTATCLGSACTSPSETSMVWTEPRKFAADAARVSFLENPLWYAAKYGNFRNSDVKTLPTDTSDWDALDLDGNPSPDGIPDAYFPVSNPAQLAGRLQRILDDIEQQAASGTSVAVTLDRRDGTGATFQAYYFPSYEDDAGNEVTWVGGLHALFLDEDLKLREDSNQNAKLDASDIEIEIYYDEAAEKTVIDRHNADGSVSQVDFADVMPVWDARDWLAKLTDTQVLTQRVYGSASSGRYIFTWLDKGGALAGSAANGAVESDEVVEFNVDPFVPNENFRVMGVDSLDASKELVQFIRGSDGSSNTRSRSITLPGGSTDQVWRLGDIVHSSPLVVARPGDGYDIDYRDSTYVAFRNQYRDRRQVVYAGANDGMVHAFNAGFYASGSGAFSTSGVHPVTGESVAEHELGAELWAYVPRNLLPHLRWLAEKEYPHVYYVDGVPQAFDVNIFTPSVTHPGGWGTILVVGFRFGGGDVIVDVDKDGSTFTSRSAYVIMDITDPEQPPTLLAEITDAQLGFTTVTPTVIKGRLQDETTGVYNYGEDAWYLVFGSGPAGTTAATKRTALLNGVSDQNAKLFVYDLNALSFVDLDAGSASNGLDTVVSDSFVGGAVAEDWNRDYLDDALYYTLVEGSDPANPAGRLNRLTFDLLPALPVAGDVPQIDENRIAMSTLLNPGKPFQGAPVTHRDLGANRQWVLAGTGRFLTEADNLTAYASRFYGVLEPLDSSGELSYATVLESSLLGTADIDVLADNSVYQENATPAVLSNDAGSSWTVANFSELTQATEEAGGWHNDLGVLAIGSDSGGSAINSVESRNYSGALAVSSGVGFVKYAPNQSVCTPAGYSVLRFVDARTGTASRNLFYEQLVVPAAFSAIGTTTLLSAETAVINGAVAKLTLVRTNDGTAVGSADNYGGIQFDRIGSLPPESSRQSWRELPIYP